MADHREQPLVTFFVMAYNQSRFVREAVEGALAQDYSPLEIVLSDDCSTDDTFEIIQEIANNYSGPHTIVVNRNERNIGLSGHLNKIIELASGELIIAADGDDVSSSRRTQRCVEVWLANEKPTALASSVACIDAAGNRSRARNGLQWFSQFFPTENEPRTESLLRFSKEGSPRLVSCSAAWTKRVCDAFGPLAPGIWFEDDVMTLRAWLLDRIVFIPEALVSYREHDSNLFNRAPVSLTTLAARRRAEESTRTEARRRREALLSYEPDLDLAVRQQWITPSLCEEIKRRVVARCSIHRVVEDWWSVGWIVRLGLLLFLIRSGRLNEARWCSPRLLPLPTFVALGAIWSRACWFLGSLALAADAWRGFDRAKGFQRIRQALAPVWKRRRPSE